MVVELADFPLKKRQGIPVPVHLAERTLQTLKELDLVDYGCQFQRTKQTLLVPLLREPSETEAALLRKDLGDFKIEQADFGNVDQKPRSIAAYLKGKVADDSIARLPRSFDIIGDIAVIEIPEDMGNFSSIIGESVLRTNPQIRLVLKKSGETAGVFRTRGFEVIAGTGGMETVHREFSCKYRLDVSAVYFNPRLSRERMRVAQQVKASEVVVDMFAGVGPYSILITKVQPLSHVYSVDLNPAAFNYLKENLLMNGVADRATPIMGDSKRLAEKELRGVASRVIMNLPSDAKDYLPAASQILKAEGGMVHFYTFARREEAIGTIESSFESVLAAHNRRVRSVGFCKVIKEVSPGEVQVAIDALVE